MSAVLPNSTKVELGDRVRDKISKYEGIVTGEHRYIFGCVQFSVASEKPDAGKDDRARLFDDGQLEILAKAAVKPSTPESAKPPGGPAREIPSVDR